MSWPIVELDLGPMQSSTEQLKTLEEGRFKTLTKIVPCGSLQARRQLSGGIQFFWRFSVGTHSDRIPVGTYDSSLPPKSLTAVNGRYSLAAAKRAAENMASL